MGVFFYGRVFPSLLSLTVINTIGEKRVYAVHITPSLEGSQDRDAVRSLASTGGTGRCNPNTPEAKGPRVQGQEPWRKAAY